MKQPKGFVNTSETLDQLEQQLFKKLITGPQSLTGGTTRTPQNPSSEQSQPIINLYNQGQVQQSLTEATQMLDGFPNSVFLYNIAGLSYGKLMNFDAAIDSYKQVLKIKLDDAGAYCNMGNALRHKGDFEAALNSFNQALKIKDDYVGVYYSMGSDFWDKRDLDSAINSYR